MGAFFLIFVFSFTIGGPFVLFKTRQYIIKKEIKRKIKKGVPEEELTLVVVSDRNRPELEWIEPHEFRFKGKMFDVVRVEERGDEQWYYCIRDDEETQLFAHLDDLVERQMNDEAQDGVIKQLKDLRFLDHQGVSLSHEGSQHVERTLTHYFFSLKPWTAETHVPPPRMQVHKPFIFPYSMRYA